MHPVPHASRVMATSAGVRRPHERLALCDTRTTDSHALPSRLQWDKPQNDQTDQSIHVMLSGSRIQTASRARSP